MKLSQFKIRQIGDGRYQLDFISPFTKKRVRKLFPTNAEALRYKHEVIYQYNYGATTGGKQYVGHLLQVYLRLHPESEVIRRKGIFLDFCDTFNHWEVQRVNSRALREWFKTLKDKTGYTDKNLNIVKWMLNYFFKYLDKEGIIESNPLKSIYFKRNGKPTRDKVVLSQAEIEVMLQNLKEFSPDFLYPFIYILVHTGARRDEVRNIKWSQIDFETGLISFLKTKNGKNRKIRMSKNLIEHLQLFPMGDSEDYLFLGSKGLPIRAGHIDYHLNKFQEAYPQKKWRCHDLRHSFAFNFLKSGGAMYELQAILGHSSIKMTIDTYASFKASDVDNASPYNF